MKILNKKLTLLIMGITIMLISLLTGSVQAASQEFGLQEYRKPIGNTQYGYKVSDKYVWKIVTYSGSAINYDKTLYCLKAEQGFFTSEPGKFKETYDLSYDFMNRNSMPTLPVPSQYYNQIVWILNHAYIPNAETATTDKTVLLQNAGITGNHELTDDDIDVVQQLAIWYFTNYDDTTYHKDMAGEASFQTVLLSAKTNGVVGEYVAIEDTNTTRYDNMDKLFVYFVENAKKAGESSNSNSSPITMEDTTATVEAKENNYIVGPFKVNKNNDTPYTINFEVTNQSGQSLDGKYKVLDANKSETNKTLEQLIGSNFYLSIPINTVNSENITNVRVAISGNYTLTQATYWTKAGDSTVQPIVEIDRTQKSFNGEEEATFPKQGAYNLKLVKVEQGNVSKKLQGATFKIVSPNGTVTETTSANGEINIGPINITQAGTDTITIEETKAPEGYEKIITSPINVQVTKQLTGNSYTMSGAQITNQQTGANINVSGNTITVTVENKLIPKNSEYNLKLVKVEQGNVSKKLQGATFKIVSPNGTVTETTNENGEINIGTIKVTEAGTDTITIEETKAPAGYEKIITSPITVKVTKEFKNNTYSISSAIIENSQEGASINLTGNTITVTVENKAKYFDLALRKYITKINDKNVTDTRIPNIDKTSLENGTTATYKHRKDPLVVKTGDKVIYNMTIYNEGNKDGRATKVVDQLPTGLKFNKIISGNFELEAYSEADNTLKLVRGQNTDNLKAYDGKTLDSETIQIECTVTAVSSNEEQILTNAAWILEEYDAELKITITDQENADRDSVPARHPDANKDNMENYIGANNKEELDDKDYYYKGQEDDDDFEKLVLKPANGSYNVELIKVDEETEKPLKGAKFKVTFEDGKSQELTTDENGKLNIEDIAITKEGKEIITIEEIEAPDKYKKLFDTLKIEITKVLEGQKYKISDIKILTQDIEEFVDVKLEDGTIKVTVKNKKKIFDLALRKFITAVNDNEVTNRIPELSMGEDGNIKYDHTKDPVEVENGNIVTYTLRIFNEGEIAGYANKVKDDVPEGLEFLPENEINKEYRWVQSEDKKSIETDYLSKEQEKTEGANLIKAFDKEAGITDENPDYRDLKIAFKVTEPNTSDRIIVNTAEITDDRDDNNDPVEDKDSTPNNNNEWNKEDDLDKEFIKVKYFDLSLKKWVSKAIVTNEDGSQTVIETGHTGDENPEPPAKVDLGRQDINKVTVKFEFKIKITNEGEIAGYAKEVTDYIPEGLKFIQEDNPLWYPRDPLNGKERVGTKQLENTLLQPGENATISILLTWINDPNNMGLKTNIAEISQDYNESHTPDIDSTPDNFENGEDDIDDAPVMLTIRLGDAQIYIGLGFIVIAMLTSGIWAIKKYVL
ncbi:MAG: Cys-Gln thioester bond-forming surface protein [Clostridium sp.]|nr:Cys-Gln thioester bond-forming surface protein [Clostridium sp.]